LKLGELSSNDARFNDLLGSDHLRSFWIINNGSVIEFSMAHGSGDGKDPPFIEAVIVSKSPDMLSSESNSC
jgi:hypothetical protein